MATPNIDFTIGPTVDHVVRYLALAPTSPGEGERYQLSFQIEFTNTDPTATLRVNRLRISFPTSAHIDAKDIKIQRYLSGGGVADDLILAPGATDRPVDFKNTDNFVLTSTPPATITFEAFVDGNTVGKSHTFSLARYHTPVAGGYRWPWRAADLRRGELWQSIGSDHCCGPQLYAHDLGIRYFDEKANAWTEMLPNKTDRSKNENYRIWGKPVFAMADGVVNTFADGILNNPNPPAKIANTPTYGNHFIINHGDVKLLYAHLQPGTLNSTLMATPNARVRAGDLLGLVGNTGNSSQPHLHIHAVDIATEMLRPIPWDHKMVTSEVSRHRADNWQLSRDQGLKVVSTLIYPGDVPPADEREWSEWEYLGGELITAPCVASWGVGRLDVFGVGTDRALYHKWWDGSRWHDWQSLGGTLTSKPAAVSWGPNRIDVFGRGTDNAVYHKWWDGSRWHDWEGLGGTLLSAPAVSSRHDHHLDLFCEATDKSLYHRIWNGSTWTPWETLGGTMTSDPAAISWDRNRIDTFVRATDNTLYHKWWNGSSWSGWEGRGKSMLFGPAVCSRRANHLDVFVTAPDGSLHHQIWDGSKWVHWESLGGQLTEGPAAVSWAKGRIDVFVRGTDKGLYHKLWRDNA